MVEMMKVGVLHGGNCLVVVGKKTSEVLAVYIHISHAKKHGTNSNSRVAGFGSGRGFVTR